MDCEYELTCLNKDRCYKCYNQALLKLPKEKGKIVKKRYDHSTATAKNSWEDLEDQVTVELNNIPTTKDARRSRASGRYWFEKGDVVDDIVHFECKERDGKEIAHGADKSLSVQRSWLEKAKHEAEDVNKPMCLPFRFKGDELIYNIMLFDDIAELITNYKQLKNENALLLEQVRALTKALEGVRSKTPGNE